MFAPYAEGIQTIRTVPINGRQFIFEDDVLTGADPINGARRSFGGKDHGMTLELDADNGNGSIEQRVSGLTNFNLPFIHRQRWTVFSIFQTVGVLRNGTSDPRMLSKDNGSGETDHTFMIGTHNSGARARCRIGFGGSRTGSGETLSTGVDNLTTNSRGVIAASYNGSTLRMFSLREDGNFQENSASRSGDVTYNTDPIAIGGNANITQNFFPGFIECVAVLDEYFDATTFEITFNRILNGSWREIFFDDLGPLGQRHLFTTPAVGGGGGGFNVINRYYRQLMAA
jgi:hypothetical protein